MLTNITGNFIIVVIVFGISIIVLHVYFFLKLLSSLREGVRGRDKEGKRIKTCRTIRSQLKGQICILPSE